MIQGEGYMIRMEDSGWGKEMLKVAKSCKNLYCLV